MNREAVDEFLAQADDVIDDWEAWESPDAATWTADGRHEEPEEGRRPGYGLFQILPSAPRPLVRPPGTPWLTAAGLAERYGSRDTRTIVDWPLANALATLQLYREAQAQVAQVEVTIQAVWDSMVRGVRNALPHLQRLAVIVGEAPPPPKTSSGMTARRYRAARRHWRRTQDRRRREAGRA